MRELKFRAWDPDMKSLSPSTTMADWLEKYALVAEASGVPLEDLSGYSEKLVFQQYTGLEDKNGVEIYEGDVIWFELAIVNNKYMGKVVFEEGCFQLKSPLANELLPLYGADGIEVIGNIYENPELLK